MSDRVTYQFEYAERLPAVFVGAGGHAYRNVYPSLAYAPVDLRAVCDIDGDRAQTYARMFGAPRSYTDHREMLERERPAVAFIVTAYHPDGRVQATDLAADCLRAGVHVWMEKPTAASAAEVEELAALSERTGRYVLTGLKKISSRQRWRSCTRSSTLRSSAGRRRSAFAIRRTCRRPSAGRT
ncbi:Gfo/Idh/MocA family protein [Fodinicola feengrottensis]|uniref:Gfo/Idh/MocA family protein n=1 Tax=Fodinicola feengrottensis TaxID=435914 RepID=UPI00244219C0|nr:Gfo/Idh/MocA family oxidoreductase [Fodinicola feengrottensis]